MTAASTLYLPSRSAASSGAVSREVISTSVGVRTPAVLITPVTLSESPGETLDGRRHSSGMFPAAASWCALAAVFQFLLTGVS